MYAPKLQPVHEIKPDGEPRDLVSVRPAAGRLTAVDAEPASLLVVDDNACSRTEVAEMLRQQGYAVSCACSAAETAACLLQGCFDVLLCDLLVAGQNGAELLIEVAEKYPEMAVVLIASAEAAQLAGEAIRRGASDFVSKPCNAG